MVRILGGMDEPLKLTWRRVRVCVLFRQPVGLAALTEFMVRVLEYADRVER